jgi:hypothetical protein
MGENGQWFKRRASLFRAVVSLVCRFEREVFALLMLPSGFSKTVINASSMALSH